MRKNIGKLTLDFDSAGLRRYGPYILAGLVTLLTVLEMVELHFSMIHLILKMYNV